MKIAVGQQGIWADKSRTSQLSGSGCGVTFSLRHTGTVYSDDFFDDGMIYHYPSTSRPGHDKSEIASTKEAGRLSLPVFVIVTPDDNPRTRDVYLGWIEDWDDSGKMFLVGFGQDSQKIGSREDDTFHLTTERSSVRRSTSHRLGQQRFKFHVLKRYGAHCALCRVSTQELLEACHICTVEEGGSDDPRNGIILCANHHKAFDAGLIGIKPSTNEIVLKSGDFTLGSLGIEFKSLDHMDCRPHSDALEWRWARWKIHHRDIN